MSDYLVRALTKTGNLRALACLTTDTVREGCERHGTAPTASAALGRSLTAAALMGALLKTGQRVALKFEGNGPLRKIIVEAESNGAVRGYVGNPDVDLLTPEGRIDVGRAIGRAGFLTVTKDLRMKEPYRSMVQLYTGEIGEDLALYLTESEQIPSAVGLGVFVDTAGEIRAAGGFLVQALPQADEEMIEQVMERISALPPLARLLTAGETPETLLERLFDGIPFDILEKHTVGFECSCSLERIERVLLSLGGDDLQTLINEQGEAAVTCEFCRKRYIFDAGDLERLRDLARH